jgi:hypothetical protein
MTNGTMQVRVVFSALFLAIVACGERAPEPPAQSADTPAPTPSLEDVQDVGVTDPAMPLDNVVTMGQPTEEQLIALTDLGFTHFVSLSSATEEGAGWEEGIAADEGIQFARIPITVANGLTRESVLELDRVLNEAAEESTVVYGATSDPAGALLALRAHWLEGADPQAALELGREAGLSELEPEVNALLAAPR